MPKTKKIAISLPADVFRKVEKARKKTGESRSAFIKRKIEYVFSKEEHDALVKQYIEGYQKFPETEDDVNIVKASAMKILAEEPW